MSRGRWAWIARSTARTCSADRCASSRARDRRRPSAAGPAWGSPTPGRGRHAPCASGSPMTRTSPAADRETGAADEGTLRALEFAAIVERLATHTSFEPGRELALALQPVPDPAHVDLLHDQTDEAARLLEDQAQAG